MPTEAERIYAIEMLAAQLWWGSGWSTASKENRNVYRRLADKLLEECASEFERRDCAGGWNDD